ncbi:MAG: NAD(P)-dependent dehydrogenase (short-subunit alcohol dehydrogenase family) [Paracoccaceae bacterium]
MSKNKYTNVAIIGASGSIGRALVQKLALNSKITNIFALSRSKTQFQSSKIRSYSFEFEKEETIETAAKLIARYGPLDLVIIATGTLHGKELTPEKNIKDLSTWKFEKIFLVNTFGPALVLKHFIPLLNNKERSICATLSARVGSISDNRLGGWYAYRASKSALNMIIKTTSIEVQRKSKNTVIVGLHPGTVDSELSRPFKGNVAATKLFTPEFAAEKLLEVLDSITLAHNGKCFAWDGQEIPS